jgi:hypothetical protein
MKEEKRVSYCLKSPKEVVLENRDWLLGGEDFYWEWFVDNANFEVVMKRA